MKKNFTYKGFEFTITLNFDETTIDRHFGAIPIHILTLSGPSSVYQERHATRENMKEIIADLEQYAKDFCDDPKLFKEEIVILSELGFN